jgi:hypothetical protein
MTDRTVIYHEAGLMEKQTDTDSLSYFVPALSNERMPDTFG